MEAQTANQEPIWRGNTVTAPDQQSKADDQVEVNAALDHVRAKCLAHSISDSHPTKSLSLKKPASNLTYVQSKVTPFSCQTGLKGKASNDSSSSSRAASSSDSRAPSDSSADKKLKWTDNDILHVKHKITNSKGKVWSRLKAVKSPENVEVTMYLIESVGHLPQHISQKQREEVIEFIFHLACLDPPEKGHRLLGILLFLLDKEGTAIFDHVGFSMHSAAFGELENMFSKHMDNTLKILNRHYDLHKKTNLQDPDLSYHTKLPLEIAKILVTSNGYINYALIDTITPFFVKNRCRPKNHEYTLLKGIKLLRKPKPLRLQFQEVTMPLCERSLANDLIRIQLGYDYDTQITDTDAKTVALSALLSHLRQGPVGSCFATHFAIVLLSSHLEKCMDDFIYLLAKGRLTRKVGVGEKDFPFLLRIGEQNESKNINLSPEGEILSSTSQEKVYLWEAPGIAAACQAIGIKDPRAAVLSLIESKYLQGREERNSEFAVDINSFLSLLAHDQINNLRLPKGLCMKFCSLANFAYKTQTRNGLQSVWENSIAEMAEGKDGGMIKKPILHCICSTLKNTLNTIVNSETSHKQVDMIIKIINEEILKRIHLHYDPNIYNHSIDTDNHSSEGGYIIYDINDENSPRKWVRVDTPYTFKEFILRVIEKVKDKIVFHLKNCEDTLLTELAEYISQGSFLYDVMTKYYPSYKGQNDLVNNWERYRYTPWRTISGNIAQSVREVYMEDSQHRSTKTLTPVSAKDLLIELIKLVKNINKRGMKKLYDNPYLRIPLITPTHAFSLMPGHPTLIRAAKSEVEISKWIEQHLIKPGVMIARQQVPPETREHMIHYTTQNCIKSHNRKEFNDAIVKLPTSQNIRRFRMSLIKLISIFKHRELTEEEVFSIDKELCLHLPKNIKKELKKTAIHFADTNWHHGIQDINLCFAVNPCTGTLSIMEILDNGYGIHPVKQYWLLNQVWEYYSNPEEVLPPLTPAHFRKNRDCSQLHKK